MTRTPQPLLPQELELKYRFVDQDAFAKAFALAQEHGKQLCVIEQENYIFDDGARTLFHQKKLCRLRRETCSKATDWILTIKAPTTDGMQSKGALVQRIEIEKQVEPEQAKIWLNDTQQFSADVISICQQLGLSWSAEIQLQNWGSFFNTRIPLVVKIEQNEYVFEFDKTVYSTEQRFELEIELAEPSVCHRVESWLKAHLILSEGYLHAHQNSKSAQFWALYDHILLEE